MRTSTGADLPDFLRAAAEGPWVWAEDDDGRTALHGGSRVAHGRRGDLRELFAAALREHFGAMAGAIAEQEIGLADSGEPALSARAILHAAACAESAQTLLSAQAAVMRIAFSAEMYGHRFTRRCAELGIEPNRLSLEQRRAIDAAMAECFSAHAPPTDEDADQRLGELLQPTLH